MSDAAQLALPSAQLRTLDQYLGGVIENFGALKHAKKFSDGQSNPTYLLTTSSGQYVLRRQPFGELLKSAHAVDREYRVLQALFDTDVPVARPIHLCKDRDVIGSLFYVMSYEDGRIFWKSGLPQLAKSERREIYLEMNRVLARLHSVNVEDVGLQDYGRPGNYFERQISRWTKQYRLSETTKIPAMEALIDWLPANTPADDGTIALIHGDYRMDNVVFSNDAPVCRAVLDWELSTLGNPIADIAYQCMQLRVNNDAKAIAGLGGIDRNALGIPSEDEYVSLYCQARGIDVPANWNFYLAFSFFRFAGILQGVLKRAIEGNASSEKALKHGAMVPVFAKMAVELYE
jgi:aminoglycoside phosphotransferase (APT) family kinase protein